MSKPSGLTDQERADLVAYLDGELAGEAARALEAKLSLDPEARAEAEALKRTWDLLDFLPKSEPSPTFTHRTLSRIVPQETPPIPASASGLRRWRTSIVAALWLIAVMGCGVGGYVGYNLAVPREPGERELVRDLRVIENKRYYDLVGDIEFLKKLDHPDLFGEDGPGD